MATPRKTPATPSTRSGNPARRAAAAKAADPAPQRSTASSWKKAAGASDQQDLPLPSGNVALVRRISPEAFIAKGLVPDAMAPILEEAINSKKGLPPKKQQEMMADPKMIAQALETMNAALVYAVLDPVILPAPGDGDERKPELLYADEVQMEDKIFIFNWAMGGTADLESFRNEFGTALAGLATGTDVAVQAQ